MLQASPENRYHYEGRSAFSNPVRVSDGNTIWIYHSSDQRYTVTLVSAKKSDKNRTIPIEEMALFSAQNLHEQLSRLAKPFNSAELLRNASLKINGHKVPCYVVRVRSADEKRPSPNASFEKTIWIHNTQLVVLRIVEHAHVHERMARRGSAAPAELDSVTTFHNTHLDSPVSEDLFHFAPPAEAKLVEEFPDPTTSLGANLLGEAVPPLQLKSANGGIRSLDSFRGKPVLIDFWATWCGPCVTALPKLDKIYHDAADQGLVLISIDRDEEARTASGFLSKKG